VCREQDCQPRLHYDPAPGRDRIRRGIQGVDPSEYTDLVEAPSTELFDKFWEGQ